MPKRRVLKNQNEEYEQPQQQEQHVEEGQSTTSNELQRQPPRKITQTVKKSPPKEYRYLTTVKSSEELDEFRFQNYCSGTAFAKRHTFTSLTLPCTRKRTGKNCHFELKAFRCSDSGDIHIYAFAEHNHPFESEVKRMLSKNANGLMPDGNPPSIFRTPDNIEWAFFQTLPDYDTFDKFRLKNNCERGGASDRNSRIRCYCMRSHGYKDKCKFMLLAVKTTKRRFHVYSYGEHNHPLHKIKKMQKSTHGKKKSRQEQMEDADEEGEVPMEEEQDNENEPLEGEEYAEDIAQPEQDEQIATEDEEYSKKCQRRLQSNLHKYDMVRAKKWMRRIDQTEIGRIIAELEIKNVANLMSMADTDIGIFEETLPFWLPWMKKAIRKWQPELVEHIMEFKELLKVESLSDKLKGKIRKMLGQWRLEIEAQKMVPEETSSDEEN